MQQQAAALRKNESNALQLQAERTLARLQGLSASRQAAAESLGERMGIIEQQMAEVKDNLNQALQEAGARRQRREDARQLQEAIDDSIRNRDDLIAGPRPQV